MADRAGDSMRMAADARNPEDAAGWAVMESGLAEARRRFGPRLEAAYAIGSLAHGGFAPAVSDVDLALVLDRLNGEEAEIVAGVREAVKAQMLLPLAGRLSVFWSSWAELERGSGAGRFPIADRQDLAGAGMLLAGHDRRGRMRLPDGEELRRALVREGAAFMLEKLATPERDAQLMQPEVLVGLGCREATKAVLFPARFVFTARQGRAAGNREAVELVAAEAEGPVRALVLAAWRWRVTGRIEAPAAAADLLREGLGPLHLWTIDIYSAALQAAGECDLAEGLAAWSRRLTAPSEKS